MEISVRVALHNAWDKKRLYLLAVLQDSVTHEVLQAASSKGQTDTPTGMGNKPADQSGWRLYPNPVSGYLNIACFTPSAETSELTLRNAQGQPCLVSAIDGTVTSHVLVSDLPPGLYSYELATPGKPAARGRLLIVR